ncbi:MAG TPA: c-type cytochrome [Flavitalea sp.]|nr:c-type cytochrome [Flavitalea sp.]
MRIVIATLISVFLFQHNNPPVVKITVAGALVVEPNATIRYSISVADKEDGDSKYDEISPNEMLLTAASAADTASINRMILHSMMASNCMNCHAFTTKLIGPSFSDISTRYLSSPDHSLIIKHVRQGSKGIWGDIVMPTHSELTLEETSEMVKWIVQFNLQKNVQYFTGREGMVRVQKPIVLTASYLDHQKSIGVDELIIKVK